MKGQRSFYTLLSCTLCKYGFALLLSDLPTPSFVLDMQTLQRNIRQSSSSINPTAATVPSIYIPRYKCTLVPSIIASGKQSSENEIDQDAPVLQITFNFTKNESAAFLHTSVTRSKHDAVDGQDDPVSSFLAEVDLTPPMCGQTAPSTAMDSDSINQESLPAASLATLVLGLNNHHVGPYYWARSAGTGASMDAPGIQYDASDISRGILRWESVNGPTECNSNDGKRSEWANFLRVSDTVQLIPSNGQDAIMAFANTLFDAVEGPPSSRIYGVSSEGRPLGSEPEVVCQWSTDFTS